MPRDDEDRSFVTAWPGRMLRFLGRRATPREGGLGWLFREDGPEEADLLRAHQAERRARVERVRRIDALVATFGGGEPLSTRHTPDDQV